MPQFRAPKGTFDVLPPQSRRYEALIARFAEHVERAGYGLVVSPMFEEIGVFSRVGESTDIVRKEMYDFEDKGGRRMALRPEGTASVVRAFVEHRPTTPFKAWYAGPNFRYEQPQSGRYRQHHQVGVEAIGSEDPDLDVEVVALAHDFYAALGLTRVELRITSLGDAACRPAYRDALQQYLEARREQLCDEHEQTLGSNPLRVLDCKRPKCVEATADAPRMVDHLCADCAAHYDRVKAGLDALGVSWEQDSRLVRGLDYYTRTTFEFAGLALDSAQNGVGGGGRYDGLSEDLGGPPAPAIGFGMGIERILLACDAEGVFPAPDDVIDVYVIDTTGGQAALTRAAGLRRAGIRTDRGFDNRSFRAQMKTALKSGARLALVIEDEGMQLRTLQEKGEPVPVTEDELIERVEKMLG